MFFPSPAVPCVIGFMAGYWICLWVVSANFHSIAKDAYGVESFKDAK